MSALLRHPVYPFDTDKASKLDVSLDQADFPLETFVYTCDDCNVTLWQKQIYRPHDASPCDALCATCAAGKAGVTKVDADVPVLFIGSEEEEAVAATAARRESGQSLFIFDGPNGEAVEVLDMELVQKLGPCRMHSSKVSCITRMLSSLRLRKPALNGMMSGLLCLLYQHPEKAGNKFHAMNFLVDPDRKVFFIDVCARNERDRFVIIHLIVVACHVFVAHTRPLQMITQFCY